MNIEIGKKYVITKKGNKMPIHHFRVGDVVTAIDKPYINGNYRYKRADGVDQFVHPECILPYRKKKGIIQRFLSLIYTKKKTS